MSKYPSGSDGDRNMKVTEKPMDKMDRIDELVNLVCTEKISLGFCNYVKLSKQFLTAYPDTIFVRGGKSCIGHEFVDKIKDALDLLKEKNNRRKSKNGHSL